MLSYDLVNSNVTLKILLAFVVLRLPFNSQSLRFLQQIAILRCDSNENEKMVTRCRSRSGLGGIGFNLLLLSSEKFPNTIGCRGCAAGGVGV